MIEVIILAVAVLSGILTYLASIIIKRGSVVASAIVTLASGLVLPHFFPELGDTLAAVAACASYAGMISVENALDIKEMAAISLMTGILYLVTTHVFVGIGGKLGTVAAISCFAWLGVKKTFKLIEGEERR